MPSASTDFERVTATGLFTRLIERGALIPHTPVDRAVLGEAGAGASLVLEHPKLPFVSYPYEWTFGALQAAALLHLDIQLEALQHRVALSDASAYNVQFLGAEPLFIDTLSFRPYAEGSYWVGHRQFCEQFLVPLLLRSHLGVNHHAWYRGSIDGIPVADLERLLPWWRKLTPNLLMHVALPARLQQRARARESARHAIRKQNLPAGSFAAILRGLRDWIGSLRPAPNTGTVFQDYASNNTYSAADNEIKSRFVATFVADARPEVVLDLGCNTGRFAAVALGAGARYVVGLDSDTGSLDRAYADARRQRVKLLPLHMNLADPSPRQGWQQNERSGLEERCAESCDAVLALALVHHLAIAGNVPLARVVDWLVGLAPSGVIEFVPKADPMVQRLLALRDDVFEDYSETAFLAALEQRAEVVEQEAIPGSGRSLFRFQRRDAAVKPG